LIASFGKIIIREQNNKFGDEVRHNYLLHKEINDFYLLSRSLLFLINKIMDRIYNMVNERRIIMALSLATILILGVSFNKIFEKLKLPGLLGMLVLGVLIGPYGINIINKDILTISADLRKIALIVILLRAGLGIKKETLNKVGIPAIKMSFIPGLLEGFIIMLAASFLLDISIVEAGMLGFIIAAVSPAVIVPQMLGFIDRKMGEEKGIPTIILAGASIDDVFAITLFSAFLGLYGGKNINVARKIIDIPISILSGVLLGVIAGFIMVYIFKKYHMRDTKKVLIVLGAAILITAHGFIIMSTSMLWLKTEYFRSYNEYLLCR